MFESAGLAYIILLLIAIISPFQIFKFILRKKQKNFWFYFNLGASCIFLLFLVMLFRYETILGIILGVISILSIATYLLWHKFKFKGLAIESLIFTILILIYLLRSFPMVDSGGGGPAYGFGILLIILVPLAVFLLALTIIFFSISYKD